MRGDAQLDQALNIKDLTPIKSEEAVKLTLSPKLHLLTSKLWNSVSIRSAVIRSSALIDPTGNINRIDFVAVKVNQGLPNSGFSFTSRRGESDR